MERINLLSCLANRSSKPPFSLLNELSQLGFFFDSPQVQSEPHEEGWSVKISINTKSYGSLVAAGTGASKKTAKAQAANAVLELLHHNVSPDCPSTTHRSASITSTSTSTSTSEQASDTESTLSSTASSASSASFFVQPLSRKQLAQVAINKEHCEYLESLAAEHATARAKTTYVCIDVEAYEYKRKGEPSSVLEVGIAWIEAVKSPFEVGVVHCRHLVILDNINLHNGRFVADNRDRFNFGTSELVKEQDISTMIAKVFADIIANGQTICLVGSSIQSDIDWLAELGCGLVKNDSVCDLGKAYQSRMEHIQASPLSKILDHYGVQYSNLHNGGNDAQYSLEVFLCMLEEDCTAQDSTL